MQIGRLAATVLVALAAVTAAGAVGATWTSDAGKVYDLATGTSGGACRPLSGGGMICSDGEAGVEVTPSGCGRVSGGARCVRRPGSTDRGGASTLECRGGVYLLVVGGLGSCTASDGESMECSDPATGSLARATCGPGCLRTTNAGDCQSID